MDAVTNSMGTPLPLIQTTKVEYVSSYPMIRDIESNYKEIEQVGAGAFGRVFKAYDLSCPSRIVALKKIDLGSDPSSSQGSQGFPITALREIMILQRLSHPNVVKMFEVLISKSNFLFYPEAIEEGKKCVLLCFEYMEHDLLGLIARRIKFTPAQTKCILKQILLGIKYMHDEGLIHRDIKTANILVNNQGEVKIADFGLGRIYNQKGKPLTVTVMTMIYRAPEVLFGQPDYTSKVDMFSLGCVFAELLISEPLFCTVKSAASLAEQMFCRMGTPDETSWPGVTKLHYYDELAPKRPYPEGNLSKHCYSKNPKMDKEAFSLLSGLLMLNPEKRMTAEQALSHPYFHTEPLPCEPKDLPRVEKECHELEIRKQLQAKKERERLIQMQALQGNANTGAVGQGGWASNPHQGFNPHAQYPGMPGGRPTYGFNPNPQPGMGMGGFGASGFRYNP